MTENDFPSDLPGQQPIQFHFKDISLNLSNADQLRQWIKKIIRRENCSLESLDYIFCTDDYLHQVNLEYLQHDTLTDIITFPYQEPPIIEGDIFISVERIKENAETYGVPFEEELHRVMIHGVLHLCGYPDKSPEEKSQMTAKEDEALELLRKQS